MNKKLYFIKNITNLFVGAGDVNYNIVDKEVERDPLTGQPIIHSSGIKGAVRAHVESKYNAKDAQKEKIEKFFGKSADSNNMEENSGAYKFMNAYLLYRPLRAYGTDTFVKTTSVALLKDYVKIVESFGLDPQINEEDIDKLVFPENVNFITSYDIKNIEGDAVENDTSICDKFKSVLGDKFAIANNLSDYELPVIARNNLKDTNLWYEEYVPRESCFYFVLLSEKLKDENNTGTEVENNTLISVEKELEDVIQIGGNASIGYGYCKFELQSKK